LKRIALINQKGGVGKTTSTLNIGAALAQLKKAVLLVDLDPQAHLTYAAGIPAHELERTVYEVLQGKAEAADVTLKVSPGISLIPSSLDLSAADIEFSAVPGREHILKDALKGVRGYDYMLIDCPPSLGLLTINALAAVHSVYIPLQSEYLAMQGLKKLFDTVDLMRRRINHQLKVGGIICTRFDRRRNLNKDVANAVKKRFGKKVFNTPIRENIALAEAPSYGQDIFKYRPRSYGAHDYMVLCHEILKRERDHAREKDRVRN